MQTIRCEEARPLIPAWADGELSEAQAAPLREHLLACHECRNGMQGLRALKRWFVQPEAGALVPAGFAGRVARRAFAGDTGERFAAEPVPAAVGAGSVDEGGRLLQFVLRVTAAAALVAIAVAIGLQARELPGGSRLQADDVGLTTEEILDELRQLNAAEEVRPEEPEPAAEVGR